jgi:hypothetical protein
LNVCSNSVPVSTEIAKFQEKNKPQDRGQR